MKEMMERVDCATCREIAEQLAQALVLEMQLQCRIDEFCRPVREGNAARTATFKSRQKWSIIGRFFKEPKVEPDPDYTSEVWYVEKRHLIDAKMTELKELRTKDVPHWGTLEDAEISKTLVGCFLAKDGHQVTSR